MDSNSFLNSVCCSNQLIKCLICNITLYFNIKNYQRVLTTTTLNRRDSFILSDIVVRVDLNDTSRRQSSTS